MSCARLPSEEAQRRVTFLAAASAKEAMEEAVAECDASSEADVAVSVGASNALAQQILSGAPADLFLSASEEWADAIAKEGLLAERTDLLTNRLVLVVPRGNPAGVHGPEDLLREEIERVALAEENVPAGRYARQALRSLDLFDSLSQSGKIASGHDVRATLAFVERGETEAGIVYATDAVAANRVDASQIEVVHEFDPTLHDAIVYPLVLLKAGQTNPQAVELFERLRSPESLAIFRRWGFEPLPLLSAAR